MNLDERRLREITEYLRFYDLKLDESETELEKDLITEKINELNKERTEILARCNI